MKTVMTILTAVSLMTLIGCMSPQGGGMTRSESFNIAAPTLETVLKQGDRTTVTVSLFRGKSFKRDVTLDFRPSRGISVDPTTALVRAGDTPKVQIQIAASEDAAIGVYRVYVKGTPETGESTSTEFKVKVVTP